MELDSAELHSLDLAFALFYIWYSEKKHLYFMYKIINNYHKTDFECTLNYNNGLDIVFFGYQEFRKSWIRKRHSILKSV